MTRESGGSAAERVAIVGGGPSAVYLMKAFVGMPREGYPLPGEIVVFEKKEEFGLGLPYDPGVVLPVHNLAANETVSRIDKGRELRREFHRAVHELRAAGVLVRLAPGVEVLDVAPEGALFRLELSGAAPVRAGVVILAIGHWDPPPAEVEGARVLAPWPAATLRAGVDAGDRVVVVGTSLTGADAAIAIAEGHGRFEPAAEGMAFRPHRPRAAPAVTLASRGGWLPRVAGYGVTAGFGEDDSREKFDHVLSPAAVGRLRDAQGGFVRLRQVYRRFVRDMVISGAYLPGYAGPEGGEEPDVRRDLARLAVAMGRGEPLARLRLDLRRARRSIRTRTILPWQSLLWQKTNIFRDCFGLYPAEDRILLDRYAAVVMAHQRPINLANAERLHALARAGVLRVARLGPSYHIEPGSRGRGVPARLRYRTPAGCGTLAADVLVSATGQPVELEASDQPLARALLRRRLVAPRLIPFLSERAGAAAREDPFAGPRVVESDGRFWYRAGGIDVDRHTCGVRSPRLDGDRGGRLFALGPLTLGLFPISDGLHALGWLVPRITREIGRHLGLQRGRSPAGTPKYCEPSTIGLS